MNRNYNTSDCYHSYLKYEKMNLWSLLKLNIFMILLLHSTTRIPIGISACTGIVLAHCQREEKEQEQSPLQCLHIYIIMICLKLCSHIKEYQSHLSYLERIGNTRHPSHVRPPPDSHYHIFALPHRLEHQYHNSAQSYASSKNGQHLYKIISISWINQQKTNYHHHCPHYDCCNNWSKLSIWKVRSVATFLTWSHFAAIFQLQKNPWFA